VNPLPCPCGQESVVDTYERSYRVRCYDLSCVLLPGEEAKKSDTAIWRWNTMVRLFNLERGR